MNLDDDRWHVEAALGLIAGARWMTALSMAFTAAAAFTLALFGAGRLGLTALASVVIALGLAQTFLALRCTIDARLFRRLRERMNVANPTATALPSLDSALQSLGWIDAAKAGRPLATRVAGVARLVRLHGLLLVAQAMALPWLGWLGGK